VERVTRSAPDGGRLLHQLGYAFKSVRKTREGKQSPDRNATVEHINRTAKSVHEARQPWSRSIPQKEL